MNNIAEIMLQLPPVIGVTLDTHRAVPQLFSIRDITYHLQMCYYWLRTANTEMRALQGSDGITEGLEGGHKLFIPTLLGPTEQLAYISKQLIEITQDTWDYIDNTPMPSEVKYKLDQAYNNMMQALFNTELSTTYYDQLTRGQRIQ